MENPVDHTIDLGFVNYVQHPENKNYVVFRFVDAERAKSFKGELKAKEIWFEDSISERKGKDHFLIAVHHSDFKAVQGINFKVEAMHKKPFIPFKWFRYFIMLVSAVIMGMAIIGYCEQQKKLEAYENTDNGIITSDELR